MRERRPQVPPEEIEFDPFSEDYFNGPFETYRRLREDAPVYYNEKYDFYALSRHVDVAAGHKNFETYSSAEGVDLGTVQSGEPPMHKSIITMDPPEHRHMRGLVNKVFTPRAIEELRPLATDLIDRHLHAADPAKFDVVQDFSALFPIEVITTMLGVPDERRGQIRLWLDDFLHREPGAVKISQAGLQAALQMLVVYYQVVKERRARPRNDMISDLVSATVQRENGEVTGLDNTEIAQFALVLGGAGAVTVTRLVASMVVLFAQHPEQWEKLQADRSKIPAAVEEVLRYESPTQYNVRRSREDVTLHGVTIPAGKPVFLLVGAANRDPDAWKEPDVFDIDRDRTQALNLGFGFGIHTCLGAALARMESAIALQRLLDFMPRYEVDWDGCQRVNMQNLAGWNNVPVRVLP
ncbi:MULTISPECIES: cytochrome P450 [unclassified Nocardia]|uniref:cytochrome P450 n=1 Tax=Nocardia sp. NPDC058114 TaxID=3346346 RepID=UPI0036DE6BC3